MSQTLLFSEFVEVQKLKHMASMASSHDSEAYLRLNIVAVKILKIGFPVEGDSGHFSLKT
jgi:hypothetical protein